MWQLVVKHLLGQIVKPDMILRKVAAGVGIQGDPLHSSIILGDACQAFNSTDEAYWVDFLKEKAQDEVIRAAAREQAKISLGHEVQQDNAQRIRYV